ncbi:hypothetical protein Tco_1194210 [Tanacetum coccineum]
MEPDIENMTMSEYLEYEATKEGDYGTMFDPKEVQQIIMRRVLTLFIGIRNYLVSTNESNNVDIENMIITEYNLYVAKQGLGMSPLRAEDIKQMGHDIVQDSIWEHDDDSKEDQEEDDKIVQPLIPEPIHTTPPNDDYVAPATKSILDKLLEEFGDEILNVATIDEEADPTKDLKELERLLAMRPQSNFTEIQVHREITSPGRLKHAKLILGYRDACEIRIRLIPLIMEYLVNISKRRAVWSLNEDILKINDSDNQYAVSIKEDTAYLFLHSPKTTKETSSIRRIQRNSIHRIQDIVCEYSGRYQTWRHFKSLSLDELRSPNFNLFSDQEYSEEEEAKALAETMEQYMSKTRTDYGSGVARPKIEEKDSFELRGQFLKELRENTFSGSDNEDANEHIEKVLEVVDLFHVPNIIEDQLMLRVFPISLTGAASRWLRNEPTSSIKT